MQAWMIRWDWTGDAASIADSVVGILNFRTSKKRMMEIVEFLYAQHTANVSELAAYARRRSNMPYRAESDFNCRIRCGSNPFLCAEIVTDLEVTSDPVTGIETITWSTPPIYEPTVEGPKLSMPSRRDGFRRLLTGPISHEMMWDRSANKFKDKFEKIMKGKSI